MKILIFFSVVSRGAPDDRGTFGDDVSGAFPSPVESKVDRYGMYSVPKDHRHHLRTFRGRPGTPRDHREKALIFHTISEIPWDIMDEFSGRTLKELSHPGVWFRGIT